jgi:Cu+-exporting ATPase
MQEEPVMAIDPVCGMSVDPATAAAVRRHDGRNWFFCAEGCAEAFDDDPQHYANATPPDRSAHRHH